MFEALYSGEIWSELIEIETKALYSGENLIWIDWN